LKRYCIDTSGLTFLWRDFYPPDVFPSLWNDIETCINDRRLISPDEVLEELKTGGDSLYDWAKAKPDLFVRHDTAIQGIVSDILAHPEHSKLLYSKHATSLVVADPFVIAAAQVHGCSVVSNESFMFTPSPNKTKIPNVCADRGIEHLSVLEFIKEQGWSY
jgi:Domain of unknown function (DUF4411)